MSNKYVNQEAYAQLFNDYQDLAKRSSELCASAQAVLDRWHSPLWEWTSHGPTADLMNDLRKALRGLPEHLRP